jgi:hypothetical protein
MSENAREKKGGRKKRPSVSLLARHVLVEGKATKDLVERGRAGLRRGARYKEEASNAPKTSD